MRLAEREQVTTRMEARSGDIMRNAADAGLEQQSAGHPPMTGSRRLGQVIGILVFLLGIGVIVFVLIQAFHLYQNPTAGISGGTVVNPSAVQIGRDFVGLIVRIALLFLGSISGSLIANKGINLYFSALRRE